MRNEEVIKKFYEGGAKPRHTLNVFYDGKGTLINYQTIMAKIDYINHILYLNRSYYSNTTSKIQSYLQQFNNLEGFKVIKYYGNRYGDNYEDVNAQWNPIASYTLSNTTGLLIYKVNEDEIQFTSCYFDNESDMITRKIQYGKDSRAFFKYGTKIYLDEIIRI